MPETIRDGTGTSYEAKVDPKNQLHTRAVSTPVGVQAAIDGRAYNLNTGKIAVTSGTSAILYFYNGESTDFVIEAIAFGVTNGSPTDIGEVFFINNPTAGTIISNATDGDMKQNRNAGSSNALLTTTKFYKGVDGATATGGSAAALFFQGDNGRLFANFPFVVPKGNSIALTYEPNGSVSVYGALVGHVRGVDE